jgi:hypothetical protein
MSHRQVMAVAAVAVIAALQAPALASGRTGGGGGGGGTCAPLAMIVKVSHADGNGNSGINAQATIRNCTSVPEQLQLNVSVPGSSTIPFKFSTGAGALPGGGSLTMNASPIGSTPTELRYGQTYKVVGTLTESAPNAGTLATVSTPVTMPAGPVA